jgi:hypothetical protein
MIYKYTTIGPTPKFFDYRLFGQFLNFSELPRQFEPDISGSWPGHGWVLGSWVYKGAPYPLRTLGFYFHFHSISCGGQGLGDFGSLPPIPFSF